MSALTNSHARLANAWQTLEHQWQAAHERWKDPVSERFEREYWQEFEHVVPATMDEMSKMAQLLAQAQRDVK